MEYNPSRSTWLNPNIEYLFNNEIIEYDMRDAGYNIIRHFHLLPKEEMRRLIGMEKEQRHRAIGILQRDDKELAKQLSEKFTEMRRLFIEANHLDDNTILSVKKDAIFTIGECKKLRFGEVEFISKNRYTSYLRLTTNMNIELYYCDGDIEVKGIGDIQLNRHRLYLLTVIQRYFMNMEEKNRSLKRFIRTFVDSYKSGKLEEEYYIEFNNMSRDMNPPYNFQKLIIPLVLIMVKEMG